MISMAKFREALGSVPSQESQLVALRDAVVSMWERATRMRWRSVTDYRELFRFPSEDRPRVVFVHVMPATSVNVWEWDVGETESDRVAVAASDLDVEPKSGRVERRVEWFSERVLTLTSGGYADDECDADVRQAIVEQAKFMRARFDKSITHLSQQAFESGSTTFASGALHPMFAEMARYCRRHA